MTRTIQIPHRRDVPFCVRWMSLTGAVRLIEDFHILRSRFRSCIEPERETFLTSTSIVRKHLLNRLDLYRLTVVSLPLVSSGTREEDLFGTYLINIGYLAGDRGEFASIWNGRPKCPRYCFHWIWRVFCSVGDIRAN